MKLNKKIVEKYRKRGISGVISATLPYIYRYVRKQILIMHYRRWEPKYGLNKSEQREKKIIVSLTSYPTRFPTLHICIKTLLDQSYKPDKIILYLGDDSPKELVGENILQLVPYGLEIAHRPGNLKPHKKYFYSMQEYPDHIIVTADDDLIYHKDWLQTLINSYQRNPNAVSAVRVHKILTDSKGELLQYNNFDIECRTEVKPSHQLLITTGSGALYPPGCIPSTAFDAELIEQLCLNADDIWLHFMRLIANVPVVWAPGPKILTKLVELPSTQKTALRNKNTGLQGDNDMYIKRMEEYFSVSLADYCH